MFWIYATTQNKYRIVTCRIKTEMRNFYNHFHIVGIFCLLFCIPLALITGFYIAIGIAVWKSSIGHATGFFAKTTSPSVPAQIGSSDEEDRPESKNHFQCCLSRSLFYKWSQRPENESRIVKTKPIKWKSHFARAKKRNKAINGDVEAKPMRDQTKPRQSYSDFSRAKTIKVTKMLLTVVLTFALLWLPIQLLGVFAVFNEKIQIAPWLVKIIKILSHINYCINPFIYTLFSKQFRKIFVSWLKCKKIVDKRQPTNFFRT
ncbi:hypothetical protein Ciccas_011299, partial [Cichlidogyrus casuarinus]